MRPRLTRPIAGISSPEPAKIVDVKQQEKTNRVGSGCFESGHQPGIDVGESKNPGAFGETAVSRLEEAADRTSTYQISIKKIN